MEFRTLGDSDLRVSEICLATWTTFCAAVSGVDLDEATIQAIEEAVA